MTNENAKITKSTLIFTPNNLPEFFKPIRFIVETQMQHSSLATIHKFTFQLSTV